MRLGSEAPAAYYHCVSKVADPAIDFDAEAKDRFLGLLNDYEVFCELRVLTYCVMPDHFHVLLESTRLPDLKPDAKQILAKLSRMSGNLSLIEARAEFEDYHSKGDAEGEARWLRRYHARMWDISPFMKCVKCRFTQWLNGCTGRHGPLWGPRFKSLLVDGSGSSLALVAAYIDLNPVRAGLVEHPKDYRWTGYAEAVSGSAKARRGIQTIMAAQSGGEMTATVALERYGRFLSGDGIRSSTEARDKALAKKQRLPASEFLRTRVRYFTDGAVLGSREFVDEFFHSNRHRFGPNRKSGARRIAGLDQELYALRGLQLNLFGRSKKKPA